MSQKVPDILRLVKIIASLISPTCSEHGSTLWWRDLRKNVRKLQILLTASRTPSGLPLCERYVLRSAWLTVRLVSS